MLCHVRLQEFLTCFKEFPACRQKTDIFMTVYAYNFTLLNQFLNIYVKNIFIKLKKKPQRSFLCTATGLTRKYSLSGMLGNQTTNNHINKGRLSGRG